MEYDLFFFCDLSYFLNGLDRSNFIIRMHYRDQNCLWSNCFFNIIRIHDNVFAYRKICNFETVFFEIFTGVKDGMMFLRAYPFIARLSDSVPLPVNMISSFLAPIRSATSCLASSIALLACRPIV